MGDSNSFCSNCLLPCQRNGTNITPNATLPIFVCIKGCLSCRLQLKPRLKQVKLQHHNKFDAGPTRATKGFIHTLFTSPPQNMGKIDETPLLFPWQEFPTYEERGKK